MEYASITASQRRALIIGINKYPKILGRNLHGAVLDAQGYKMLLEQRFGFASHELCTLVDEQATRDAIMAMIDEMIAWGTAGCHAVIIYCGHGRQIVDMDSDEDDGMDETLVPHDSGTGLDNRDILDDELWSRIVTLNERGVMVTTLFDSCHSGSATRDPAIKTVRGLPAEIVSGSPRASSTQPQPPRKPPLRRDRIHIAACRADQVAGEIQVVENSQVVRRGAFSYHLQRVLARAPISASWRSVFDSIFAEMLVAFPKQQSQSEGLLDCAVFSRKVVEPGHPQRGQLDTTALASVAPQSRLAGNVSVSMWRLAPNGCWLPISLEDALPTLDAGDCLSLTAVSSAATAVYLQVLRINCAGEQECLYPRHTRVPLLSQCSVELFRLPEDRLQLVLPEEIATEDAKSALGEATLQETLQIIIEEEAGTRHVVTVPYLIQRITMSAQET